MPPRKPRPEAPGAPLVYVVRCEKSGLLKIGTTTDLPRRLAQLSRLVKGAVTLVAALPGDAQLEHHLHALCAADLVAGEWFRPSGEVLDLVERAKESVRAADAARKGAATADSHDRAAPSSPAWLVVELRLPLLPACPCVRSIHGAAYARAGCAACNGAGVLPSNHPAAASEAA